MRTNRTGSGARSRTLGGLALVLGLTLSLVAFLAPPGAGAATRTDISGWSTAPLVLQPTADVRRTVTVLTGGRGVERRVLLQHRLRGAASWGVLAAARSNRRGVASLHATDVPGSGALRVKVPATSRAAAALTPITPVTVTAPPDPPDPGSAPTAFESEVLRLTNQVRAAGTTCGGTAYGPKPPVSLSHELTSASRAYATRMGTERFFDHVSPTGDDPGDRATAAGYAWQRYGENIAAGYRTPAAVVEGWRTSAGHCRNMMGDFVDLGVGHAEVVGSPYGHYWVQMFGVPR